MLLWPLLLVLAALDPESDQLSIDMPHDVYEGDEVVVRCSAVSSGMIGKVMYYKDESLLATHYHPSGYTIPKASPSDSGSYPCEVHQLVFYRFTTERTSSVWLTVQELFPAPTLTVRPSQPTEGSSVTLSCDTQLPRDRSGTQLRYSFFRDDHTLRSDGNSSEFQISAVWKEDSGYYWCEVATASHSVLKPSPRSHVLVQSEPRGGAAGGVLGGRERSRAPGRPPLGLRCPCGRGGYGASGTPLDSAVSGHGAQSPWLCSPGPQSDHRELSWSTLCCAPRTRGVPVSAVLLETQPQGGHVLAGERLVLVCSVAEGTGDTTFSWHREDTGERLGSTRQRSRRAELEIPAAVGSHTGRYYCTADNGHGLARSGALNVTVTASRPVLTLRAPRTRAVVGDVVEFRCEAQSSSPRILYRFYHEDVILGSTSAPSGRGVSFKLSLTAEHSGNYACEADNGLGAQRSEVVTLSVTEPPPKVRLVNGAHRCEGRVEMKRDGRWGTVCDDGWDLADVAVLCRELGCGVAKHTPAGVLYPPLAEEDQPVLVQAALCSGSEEALAECEQVETFDCDHSEDAGAVCEAFSPHFS
ncbi:Fc receptor-like protein 2 isoform X2 [Meles meles]|uniref:Fc receptor-like protein 2 isoform X2 n=1 Tax=Meles meles TaxID=9662 RepID=UPI001E69EDDF|nr:Fc receptor-like protein 2 isoform X2 [Meles meles]